MRIRRDPIRASGYQAPQWKQLEKIYETRGQNFQQEDLSQIVVWEHCYPLSLISSTAAHSYPGALQIDHRINEIYIYDRITKTLTLF